LSLQPYANPRSLRIESSEDGDFQITGLLPGRYTLLIEHRGYWSYSCDDIFLDPGATLHLRISLSPSQSEQPSTSHRVAVDHTWNTHQTILDRAMIQGLPVAHNPWALVENLDLSATSNRIDVGGLYSGIPALFSARGGTSWTQSSYRLNGMDITDPYWTGRPLLYPDFTAVFRPFISTTACRHPTSPRSSRRKAFPRAAVFITCWTGTPVSPGP
jgi:hypothetical protein